MDPLEIVLLVLVIIAIVLVLALYFIYYSDKDYLETTGVAWTIKSSALSTTNSSDSIIIDGTDLYQVPNTLTGNLKLNVGINTSAGKVLGRPFIISNPSDATLAVSHNGTISSWLTIAGQNVSIDTIQPHTSSMYILTSVNSNNTQYGVSQIIGT